jgi:hypothetical protein
LLGPKIAGLAKVNSFTNNCYLLVMSNGGVGKFLTFFMIVESYRRV